MKVTVNGVEKKLRSGATLKTAIAGEPYVKGSLIAIHLSEERVVKETRDFEIETDAGTMVLRLNETPEAEMWKSIAMGMEGVTARWVTHDIASFGSFPTDLPTDRGEYRYRTYDCFLALGGFDNEVFRINPFICEYSDGPDIPFLVFKPTDVRLYRYDDPLMNADLDMYGLRMMLRACIDSVTGAARWIRTVSRPSAAHTTSGISPDGTNADTAGSCWTAAGTASSTTGRSTSGS